MKTIRQLLVVVLATALLGGCSKVEFNDFTSEEGGYTVKLPGTPEQASKETRTPAGPITIHAAALNRDGLIYNVGYGVLPDFWMRALKTKSMYEVLDLGRDGMISRVGGTLVRQAGASARLLLSENGQQRITDTAGTEALVALPDGEHQVLVHLFWYKDKLYEVGVIMPTSPSSKESMYAKRFLDSFTIKDAVK